MEQQLSPAIAGYAKRRQHRLFQLRRNILQNAIRNFPFERDDESGIAAKNLGRERHDLMHASAHAQAFGSGL